MLLRLLWMIHAVRGIRLSRQLTSAKDATKARERTFGLLRGGGVGAGGVGGSKTTYLRNRTTRKKLWIRNERQLGRKGALFTTSSNAHGCLSKQDSLCEGPTRESWTVGEDERWWNGCTPVDRCGEGHAASEGGGGGRELAKAGCCCGVYCDARGDWMFAGMSVAT